VKVKIFQLAGHAKCCGAGASFASANLKSHLEMGSHAPPLWPARASKFRTVLSYQAPPRAVRTPRLFNSAAMARNVVAPAACIWRTMSNTLAAKASAVFRFASTPLACASGRLVRFPSGAPCAFFCASVARVRFGNQSPLFLGQGGIYVQHEGVRVRPKLGHDEHTVWGAPVTEIRQPTIDGSEILTQVSNSLRWCPPSLRFLGPKVYIAAIVVLIAILRHGATAPRMRELTEVIGVDRRTVERWRTWWRDSFTAS
jgi:hypothetical protein